MLCVCKECDCRELVDPRRGFCRAHGGVERHRAEQAALAAEIRHALAEKWNERDPQGFSRRRFYRGRDSRRFLGHPWVHWSPAEFEDETCDDKEAA